METKTKEESIRDVVREKYGNAARQVTTGAVASCCGGGPSASGLSCDPITRDLYGITERSELPEAAVLASLGCGNPTALARLSPGEVVLDLGSGGGIDVLLSARRVGPTGKAYGLDMTDEMLALARENQAKAGATNVEFLKGTIEEIPLPDASVDVILSNCVINLSADKDRVLREAYRVLKPGGRLAVSDVVTSGGIPPAIQRSVELWIGCVAGALSEDEYVAKLGAAGFSDVGVETTRVYRVEEARGFIESAGIDVDAIADEVDGKFRSAFIRAIKPRSAEVPRVRALSGVDYGAVRDLLADGVLPHVDLSPERMKDFVGIDEAGALAACAGLEVHGPEGLLRSLAVSPAARRRGLGRTLVTAVEDRAHARGIRRVWLLTTNAEPFFGALGWKAVPRAEAPDVVRGTTEFRTLCPESAVLMGRSLS